MKLIIFVILFAYTAPTQAVQKCTDSDGRITYADFCSASEPVKIESLYIPDTYNAEADRQAQINSLELEQRTRQSAYERNQLNAGNRQRGSAPPSAYVDRADGSLGAKRQFEEAARILENLPYGSKGAYFKRKAMMEKVRAHQELGRAMSRQNPAPEPIAETSAPQVHLPTSSAPITNAESEYKYRSRSGTEYKYDLSNPLDRLMYDVDPLSQIMDKVNPDVNMDRWGGQYGGGAK